MFPRLSRPCTDRVKNPAGLPVSLPVSAANPGVLVLTQPLCCARRDIDQCLESALVVTTRGEVYWHLWAEPGKLPNTPQCTGQHTTELSIQTVRQATLGVSQRSLGLKEEPQKPVLETSAFPPVNLSREVLARAPDGTKNGLPPVHTIGYMNGSVCLANTCLNVAELAPRHHS